MPTVTVTGADNTVLTVQMNGVTNYQVAQQFAAVINGAAGSGTLSAFNVASGTSLPPVPAGNVGEAVILSAPSPVTIPGGYSFLTDVASTATTVTGSASVADSILAGTGGVTFNAGAASGLFVAGGGANVFNGLSVAGANGGTGSYAVTTGDGNDTINTGVGNDTVDAGAGANVITLGAGASVVTSTGVDSITGGSGAGTVTLMGSGATVQSGTGALTVNDQGSGNFVTIGSLFGTQTVLNSNSTIFGGTNGTYSLQGATNASVVGGGGDMVSLSDSTATVYAGSGSDTVEIFGTSPELGHPSTDLSQLTFVGSAGHSVVIGNYIPVTLTGADGGSVQFSSQFGGSLLSVGTGAEIDARGSLGGDTFFGGSGANTILGGVGADTFVLGSGATSITGESAAVGKIYDFIASNTGGATDVITDFKVSDRIGVSGYTANAAADVLKTATVSGGSTTITLSDQTRITLQNYTTLTSGNFP